MPREAFQQQGDRIIPNWPKAWREYLHDGAQTNEGARLIKNILLNTLGRNQQLDGGGDVADPSDVDEEIERLNLEPEQAG